MTDSTVSLPTTDQLRERALLGLKATTGVSFR